MNSPYNFLNKVAKDKDRLQVLDRNLDLECDLQETQDAFLCKKQIPMKWHRQQLAKQVTMHMLNNKDYNNNLNNKIEDVMVAKYLILKYFFKHP